ncbi:hypothetical protein [Desulforamulus hydrothermalis]|nr:hypothetical protein [Desulforamulus hydrothermalis]
MEETTSSAGREKYELTDEPAQVGRETAEAREQLPEQAGANSEAGDIREDVNLNNDGMDYWLQEFEKMLQEYKPLSQVFTQFKSKLGKPKTLLVVGGGVAALSLALVSVVAGQRIRRRTVIHTLPVQKQPDSEAAAPQPVPVAPAKRNPPPVPWPFIFFK